MKIKLCGFTNEDSVKIAVENKCDFLGFIFVKKSPRHIEIKDAEKIAKIIPKNIAKVAVVADFDFDFLSEIAQKFSPDFFQFHGNENIEFVKNFRHKFPEIKIIKAFKIKNKSDLEQVKFFENYCDFFLFDGQNPGSGAKFDWQILQDFKSKKDWFLSGGINVNNVEEALNVTKADMIDISSGIEEFRGIKSSKLITEFMNKIKSIC